MGAEELKAFAGVAGAPLVVALVEFTKLSLPNLPKRFWPAAGMFWGVLLNLFIASQIGANLAVAGFAGILCALVASRLYDSGPKGTTDSVEPPVPPRRAAPTDPGHPHAG